MIKKKIIKLNYKSYTGVKANSKVQYIYVDVSFNQIDWYGFLVKCVSVYLI